MNYSPGKRLSFPLGYSSVILRTMNFTIGIDVANLLSEKDIRNIGKMDLIVYTHIHGDHFNAAIAQEIYEKTGCFIVAEPAVYDALSGVVPTEKLVKLQGGESKEIYLQAGRIVLSSICGFHPVQIILFMVASSKCLSLLLLHNVQIILFVVEADGIRVFHGGDSGYSIYKRLRTC